MVWAPRSGRSKAFKRWRYDMLDLLGDLGFESFEDVMNLEPPFKAALAQIATDSAKRCFVRPRCMSNGGRGFEWNPQIVLPWCTTTTASSTPHAAAAR